VAGEGAEDEAMRYSSALETSNGSSASDESRKRPPPLPSRRAADETAPDALEPRLADDAAAPRALLLPLLPLWLLLLLLEPWGRPRCDEKDAVVAWAPDENVE